MEECLAFYLSLGECVCFDGEGEGGGQEGGQEGQDGGQEGSEKGAKGDDRTFNKNEVNQIVEERLARDRKTREEQNKKLETRLQEVLKSKELSDQERGQFEESLEDVRKQLRSKEQQASHEKKQMQEEHEVRLKAEKDRADLWEQRYRDESISRALMDAASTNDAYNPRQIVNLLSPMTKLVEEKDKVTGQPTGRLTPKVDFPELDAEGNEVLTQGTPDEIVSRMKDLGDYANLFKANVVSGIGANSATGGLPSGSNGRIDVRNLTPEQYMKLRKEKPELLDLK